MGQFAQMSLPLADSATLTIVRVNHTIPETISVSSGVPSSCFNPFTYWTTAAIPLSHWHKCSSLDKLGFFPPK